MLVYYLLDMPWHVFSDCTLAFRAVYRQKPRIFLTPNLILEIQYLVTGVPF